MTADLPPHWRAYARMQDELSNLNQWVSEAWGLEACLNHLTEEAGRSKPPCNKAALRAQSAGSRRERHRRRLRRQNFVGAPTSPIPMIEARSSLAAIHKTLKANDWSLLHSLGEGAGYTELALIIGCQVGALRVHVSRLRKSLRMIA